MTPDATILSELSETAPTEKGSLASIEAGRATRAGLVTLYPRTLDGVPNVWSVQSTTIVGRGRGAEVRVDDGYVSRKHAELRGAGEGVLVRDLGSRHGSSFSGRPLGGEPVLAGFGSVLRFGNTLFLVVEDVDRYHQPARRLTGSALGLSRDLVAGPTLSGVWDQAIRIASLSQPVLVLGESGTGKESVARLIHRALDVDLPFVGLNVAAIPESLFEAELFGHERGAFTGALAARPGAFREAGKGVLLLDEIGDLNLTLQVKLLRAVEERTIRPLGSARDVPVQCRLVASTSRELSRDCQEGRFREDLYYRLSGLVIRVPPLRRRPDEVILLALATLEEQAPSLRLSVDAVERLVLGSWDGNARALKAAVVHAVAQANGEGSQEISVQHFPDFSAVVSETEPLTEHQIRAAMRKAQGVARRAAQLLGVSRTTFYNTCKRLGVDASSLRPENELDAGDG